MDVGRKSNLQILMKNALTTLLLLLISVMSGCTTQSRTTGEESSSAQRRGKITAEAYLFDAKIRREGKVNTFRLEIFQTDSLLGLSGRGYLGKGALKGWLGHDSIQVYFPSVNEFAYESVGDLLRSFDCTSDMPDIDLMSLFTRLPDDALFDVRLTVEADYSNHKRPKFELSVDGCPWLMELKYDERKAGWRIRSFAFYDGNGNRLTAKRREYKRKAEVRPIVFEPAIPNNAVRIHP